MYYFPLDANGAVTHFEAEVEGRKIKVRHTNKYEARFNGVLVLKINAWFDNV